MAKAANDLEAKCGAKHLKLAAWLMVPCLTISIGVGGLIAASVKNDVLNHEMRMRHIEKTCVEMATRQEDLIKKFDRFLLQHFPLGEKKNGLLYPQ